MSRSDWLGIIGIALALIFGIPSLGALLSSEEGNAWAVFTLVLAGLILVLTGALVFLLKQPNWTVVSNVTHLVIEDVEGKSATFRKELVLRANRPGVDTYIHRNLSADGTFDIEVDPRVECLSHEVEAHDHSVAIRFPHHSHWFERKTTWVKLTLQDALRGKREGITLQVDHPLKYAELRVTFPEGRTPIPETIVGIHRNAGARTRLSGVVYDPQTRIITWKKKSWLAIPPGDYDVRWDW